MSGGIVWVPNNPVMLAVGVPDSYEDAMAHFEAVVGDVGPCSSFERRDAFLTAGPEMVAFLQQLGVRFVYCRGYSDYYSKREGRRTTPDGGSSRCRGTAACSASGWSGCSPASPRASASR